MSRFLKSHEINIKPNDQNSYRFGRFELSEINEDDLWELPISEFLSFDFPGAILYILDKHSHPEISHKDIQKILEEHDYPTHCGLVMEGINILEAQYAIVKFRKGDTLYIRRTEW